MKREDELIQLLRQRELFLGAFARVARKLNVHPSYVSRVASGDRTSEQVDQALLRELRKAAAAR